MQQKKELNVRVGANIQTAREKMGLTQEQVSELLQITPNHLSAIERGVTGATLEKIVQLCKLFDVSADYLLFSSNCQTDPPKKLDIDFNYVDARYRPQVQKIMKSLQEIIEIKSNT